MWPVPAPGNHPSLVADVVWSLEQHDCDEGKQAADCDDDGLKQIFADRHGVCLFIDFMGARVVPIRARVGPWALRAGEAQTVFTVPLGASGCMPPASCNTAEITLWPVLLPTGQAGDVTLI